MTSGEITAAYNSVVSGLSLITSLIGGNIQAIMTVFGLVAIVGVIALIFRGFYYSVGIKL